MFVRDKVHGDFACVFHTVCIWCVYIKMMQKGTGLAKYIFPNYHFLSGS